jgi:hypothetical protein
LEGKNEKGTTKSNYSEQPPPPTCPATATLITARQSLSKLIGAGVSSDVIPAHGQRYTNVVARTTKSERE